MGIKWQNGIQNVGILNRAGIPCMEQLLANRRPRWAGHVAQMHVTRLRKKILHSQLEHGQGRSARPKLKLKGTPKQNMQFKNKTAQDRVTWRSAIGSS